MSPVIDDQAEHFWPSAYYFVTSHQTLALKFSVRNIIPKKTLAPPLHDVDMYRMCAGICGSLKIDSEIERVCMRQGR